MGAFAKLVGRDRGPALAVARRPPPRVVTLEPSAFQDSWMSKPAEAVDVGLRLVGEDVLDSARSEAAATARDLHPDPEDDDNRIDAFNGALMRSVLARAMTHPTDVAQPHFKLAQDTLPIALTSEAVRRLWEDFEQLSVELSPLSQEATDEELHELALALASGTAWAGLERAEVQRVRRLLRHCLERMGDAEVAVDDITTPEE